MQSHLKEKIAYYLKGYSVALLLLLPFLVSFVMFFVVPFVSGINMSFFHYNIADPSDTYFVGLDNYSYFLFLPPRSRSSSAASRSSGRTASR